MSKAKHIKAFRSITTAGAGVSSSRFLEGNKASSANSMDICTVFVLCTLLITKVSVMIYISALYKSLIVSIDVIAQPL